MGGGKRILMGVLHYIIDTYLCIKDEDWWWRRNMGVSGGGVCDGWCLVVFLDKKDEDGKLTELPTINRPLVINGCYIIHFL